MAMVDVAFRRLAKDLHPDKPGGSHELMTELNLAAHAAAMELRK